MRIALVSLQHDAERMPPVGLDYLATFLEKRIGLKEIELRVIDANFEDIEKETKEYNPDIICLSAMSYYYSRAVDFAKKIRGELEKKVFIVIGGVHISTFPNVFKGDAFDVGVVGQRGEESITEMVKIFLKKKSLEQEHILQVKGLVHQDKATKENKQTEPVEMLENIDELPFAEYRYVTKKYLQTEIIPGISDAGIKSYILTSRSCPYKCIFCSTTQFWGKFRVHSVPYVVKNIQYLMDNYHVTHISMLDDLFVYSKQRVRDLIDGLEKAGILGKITFECLGRASLIDEEFCQLLQKMNIKIINFGFESGSDRVLKRLKTGPASLETNQRAIVLCKKYGFTVYGSLMFGAPGETIEDMKKTVEFIEFAIKNKADRVWSFIATPFPNTQFWEIAKERGKISEDMDTEALSHHTERPLLLDETIDTTEFFKVYNQGKRKIRAFNYGLIIKFVKKHPVKACKFALSDPGYWVERLYRQLYAQ